MTSAQIQLVHSFIRQTITKTDENLATNTRIVNGGSLKSSNASEILSLQDADGGLVGGASLDGREFAAIVNHAHQKVKVYVYIGYYITYCCCTTYYHTCFIATRQRGEYGRFFWFRFFTNCLWQSKCGSFYVQTDGFFCRYFLNTSLSLSYISKSDTDNQADTTGLTQADYQQQQAQKQQLIDKAQQLSHKDADKALPDLPGNTQKDSNISGEAVKN